MKKFLFLLLILIGILTLFACTEEDNDGISQNDNGGSTANTDISAINGVELEKFAIVYSDRDTDYSKRAAEYIQAEILDRTKLNLPIVEDDVKAGDHEIVVGNTNRQISKDLNAATTGVEFSILAKEGAVALEGNYFVIAAAAYYFIKTYVPRDDFYATIPKETRVLKPITVEAKNFILLIGDGMGVNQTLLFDRFENTIDYSDGERSFYGYMLPYRGYARTNSLSGITDSAAAATALSSGFKTKNGYVGVDKDKKELTSLTELFGSLGKSTAIMSTEVSSGATPAGFSAHSESRDNAIDILADQLALKMRYGTVMSCNYNHYNKVGIDLIEKNIDSTLTKLDNGKGFFLMYEEAHIDKHCHNNDMNGAFEALVRFNQVIGRFMEFAFYNPDTFLLITADHETGGLVKDSSGNINFTSGSHSSADVPIFAWGNGAKLFDGKTVENIQIPQTIASFIGVYDFGDQTTHTYLKD